MESRAINSLCDNALLIGFAGNASVITDQHVTEAGRDLRLLQPEKMMPHTDGAAPSSKMPLNIPPPESSRHSDNPLSLFGKPRTKRSWWRISKPDVVSEP